MKIRFSFFLFFNFFSQQKKTWPKYPFQLHDIAFVGSATETIKALFKKQRHNSLVLRQQPVFTFQFSSVVDTDLWKSLYIFFRFR